MEPLCPRLRTRPLHPPTLTACAVVHALPTSPAGSAPLLQSQPAQNTPLLLSLSVPAVPGLAACRLELTALSDHPVSSGVLTSPTSFYARYVLPHSYSTVLTIVLPIELPWRLLQSRGTCRSTTHHHAELLCPPVTHLQPTGAFYNHAEATCDPTVPFCA